MHNHSYENEFNLHVNEISFSYEKIGTKTRFEVEAESNSEMAYFFPHASHPPPSLPNPTLPSHSLHVMPPFYQDPPQHFTIVLQPILQQDIVFYFAFT